MIQDLDFKKIEYCPLCGHAINYAKLKFSVKQLYKVIGLFECKNCWLTYKSEVANDILMSNIYQQDYVHHSTSFENYDDPNIVARIKRIGLSKPLHLDYGCGAGDFVRAALNFGWNSFGVDPYLNSARVPAQLKQRLFSVSATEADGFRFLKSMGGFDCITMWAVAEHLMNPSGDFLALSSLLKKGGLLVFNSPNPSSIVARLCGYRWSLALLIEHVIFFSPKTIYYLADKYGFEVYKIAINGNPFPIGTVEPSLEAMGVDAILSNGQAESRENKKLYQPWPNLNRSTFKSYANNFFAKAGSIPFKIIKNQRMRKVIRASIGAMRIGDHIEVILIKK